MSDRHSDISSKLEDPGRNLESVVNFSTNRFEEILYSRRECPFGKTWEEWSIEWWKWVLSMPISINPGLDETGKKFVLSNPESPVVFLVGTFGGKAERSYSIPSGKSFFFPIVNFLTSYLEDPELKSDWELRRRAKLDIDNMSQKYVSIDARNIVDVNEYRVQSDIFEVYYPKNNVFHAPAGKSRAISDGFWIFMKPLHPGTHIIRVSGACSSGKTRIDVVWHLKIEL